MRTYRHLIREQRDMIAHLFDSGYAQRETAAMLRISPSTVCRELHRNRSQGVYHAGQADAQATQRRWQATSRTITDEGWAVIDAHLAQDWSPEQVSGWLERAGRRVVSPEWIDHHIYQDQAAGGT